ncbi:MAG TPA: hypothetical protein VJX74_16180 [Blastocatellia bacterium]|nr:hypothetical protein [Blastocatellia bacterium]
MRTSSKKKAQEQEAFLKPPTIIEPQDATIIVRKGTVPSLVTLRLAVERFRKLLDDLIDVDTAEGCALAGEVLEAMELIYLQITVTAETCHTMPLGWGVVTSTQEMIADQMHEQLKAIAQRHEDSKKEAQS